MAALLGLLIGLGAAFLLEYVDTSIREEDEMASVTGLPTLASIPEFDSPPLIVRDDPHAHASESYRTLRAAVQFLTIERTLDVIQVTSAQPGEGKSTTASNLAFAAARGGQRVVLVDCDLRKPQIHSMFDLTNTVGFSSVMLKKDSLQDALKRLGEEPNLQVLTSGPTPPNPSELLSSARAAKLFASLANAFDLVIIDSPPVLPVADAAVLAGLADGVVLVGTTGLTERRSLMRTIDRLEKVDAPLIGTVLNRHGPTDGGYTYSYTASVVGEGGGSLELDLDEVDATGPVFPDPQPSEEAHR